MLWLSCKPLPVFWLSWGRGLDTGEQRRLTVTVKLERRRNGRATCIYGQKLGPRVIPLRSDSIRLSEAQQVLASFSSGPAISTLMFAYGRRVLEGESWRFVHMVMVHSFHMVGSRGNILHCDPLYFLAGPSRLQREVPAACSCFPSSGYESIPRRAEARRIYMGAWCTEPNLARHVVIVFSKARLCP